MACGTGICTSSCVRARVEKLLDEHGYAGDYDVTQCKMADVPQLQEDKDFLIAITMIPSTLEIPYVNGVPFLVGKDLDNAEDEILHLMAS